MTESNETHRYSEGTVATLADFERSGWRDVAEADAANRAHRWQRFSQAAQAALVDGDAPKARILWLLADACSPVLKPDSTNEPFAPLCVIQGRRSCVPDDFSEADLVLLQALQPGIDVPALRARIADILWVRLRRADLARVAVAAYTQGGLDSGSWNRGQSDGWRRALTLALQLRAQDQIERITAEVETALLLAGPGEEGFARALARMLEVKEVWSDAPATVADKLATCGQAHLSRGEPAPARLHFEAAATWYRRARNAERQADMVCEAAESWVQEAGAGQGGSFAQSFVASTAYEHAIQAYRSIPKKMRASRGIEQRIEQLHVLMTQAGRVSVEGMGRLELGRTNITDLAREAVRSVQGKSKLDALFELALQYEGAKHSEMVEFAEKQARQTPLQSLFASTHLSADGRVVAKRPAGDFGTAQTGKDDPAVQAMLMRHYLMEIALVVQGQVIHALSALLAEHQVTEDDCVECVAGSGVVAAGKVLLVAKGLAAGFERDFLTALHLLVPQVEAMVRWHLKHAGARTTTLSTAGIETENGLSTLVEMPEMKDAFGDDLTFELKALFCDSHGPNLRNELAHGLLDARIGHTPEAVYAWWFVFRIVFRAWWRQRSGTSYAKDSSEGG